MSCFSFRISALDEVTIRGFIFRFASVLEIVGGAGKWKV